MILCRWTVELKEFSFKFSYSGGVKLSRADPAQLITAHDVPSRSMLSSQLLEDLLPLPPPLLHVLEHFVPTPRVLAVVTVQRPLFRLPRIPRHQDHLVDRLSVFGVRSRGQA